MRKETENWWKQALSDFHKAEVLYKSNDYDGVAFYCQQTVEKSLKALYITKFKKNPAKVHDLTLLCDYVEKVPEKVRKAGEKLTPSYIFARYPDASHKIPAEFYSREQVSQFLKLAEEVLQWIEKELKL